MNTDKIIISPELGHTIGIETCPIKIEEILIGTIDQIIKVKHEKTIDMMIGKITTDKMIDVTLIGKIIEEIITEPNIGQIMEETIIGNIDIELEINLGIILEIITEIIQGKGLNEVEIKAEIGVEKGNHN